MNAPLWLNFHHLRYFWTVAREGGLRQAAEVLHVSQPSISAQIHELENALGQALFRREGRANVLTDAGQLVLHYADEIFNLGRELSTALGQGLATHSLRLHAGVVDAVPKLLAHEILKPALSLPRTVHLTCREGKAADLIAHLSAHRLDIVLSDEPATSAQHGRVFNHLLGTSSIDLCAAGPLVDKLRKGFPKSLHQAPLLMPAENSTLHRSLQRWLREQKVEPQIRGEFEDAALMKVFAAEGLGIVAIPSIVAREALSRYGLERVGPAKGCEQSIYAITAERKILHPAVSLLVEAAKSLFEKKRLSRTKKRPESVLRKENAEA